MAGHATLEAARDALFLARLPATFLPWAYLAMAALALLATKLNSDALHRFSRRRLLSSTLVLGALVTLSFWFFSSLAGSAGTLVAFYVWTGVLATVLVVQFWLLLGDVLDLAQAKRMFALIGAGGLLGATLGSGLASLLLLFLLPQSLLVAGAICFCGAAFLPTLFSRAKAEPRPRRGQPASDDGPLLAGSPYLQRLLLLMLLSTITVTGVDYAFKAIVAREIAPERLGDFFARYYALMNGLALAVQLALAPRLLRLAGVHRTLLLMPTLLLFGSGAFAASAGLGSAVLLKGADGALRHSVNRTGMEILYLPLSGQVRERFKSLAEAIGQRGGQAVASLGILGAIALGLDAAYLGWALIVLALAWLACLWGLEPYYLDLFRRQLRDGSIETRVEVAELDLHTLEALVSALSSDEDAEVVAALDMFEAYHKTHLIPALILYHPSRAVVLRAFELFADSRRSDVLRLAARLLRHPDHEIRAAALRLYAASDPAEPPLRACMNDESAAVRATAIVGLVTVGAMTDDEAKRLLGEMIEDPAPEARHALALSLRLLPPERFAWVGRALAERPEPELAPLVARSMAASPSVHHIQALILLLARREARIEARTALEKLGSPALEQLERALADNSLPRALRRHLPRTISRFHSPRAAEILLRFLPVEPDDAIQFKILRGLGRLRADSPSLPVDRQMLFGLARDTLRRTITALHWKLVVDWMRSHDSRIDTSAGELLSTLLGDLEANALERVFRLLHIIQPTEELAMIYDGAKSPLPKIRAGSLELLEHVAPDGVRDGILALIDQAPDEERLTNALVFYDPPSHTRFDELRAALSAGSRLSAASVQALYSTVLGEMLHDPSGVLRSVAGYHIAELGFGELSEQVAAASMHGRDTITSLTERTLRLLEGRRVQAPSVG